MGQTRKAGEYDNLFAPVSAEIVVSLLAFQVRPLLPARVRYYHTHTTIHTFNTRLDPATW